MENKLFELMTQMYSDITKRLGDIEDKVDNNKNELKSLGNQLTVIESDMKNDIKALYDGYKGAIELGEDNKRILKHVNDKQDMLVIGNDIIKDRTEKIEVYIERIEKNVNVLKNKVEKQEIEIKVIKGGKAK